MHTHEHDSHGIISPVDLISDLIHQTQQGSINWRLLSRMERPFSQQTSRYIVFEVHLVNVGEVQLTHDLADNTYSLTLRANKTAWHFERYQNDGLETLYRLIGERTFVQRMPHDLHG